MRTVGYILKTARQEKKISFKEISEATKIHPRFLKALEEGDYDIFSSPIHIRGFIKNYAEFLGLKTDQVLAFWRREYTRKNGGSKIKNPLKPLSASKIVFTPTVVFTSVTAILIILFFGYLIFEYRSFAGAPILIVDQPAADISVSDPALNVYGRTDKDATLKINGQQVQIDEDGIFSTSISLTEGVNVVNFVAANRLGKESSVSRMVVYQKVLEEPAEPEREASPAAETEEKKVDY